MFICVRSKTSVCPRKRDDVVMSELVKGDSFSFIGMGRKKKCIVLCESLREWFNFFAMYRTHMPHANVMKKVRWEGIKLCAIFEGTRLFIQASGSFQVGHVM